MNKVDGLAKQPEEEAQLTDNAAKLAQSIQNTTSLIRTQLLNKIFDSRRDIDDECGYPKDPDITQYRYMYDREGVARRVVNVMPEEAWNLIPSIYETEDQKETEFEKAWKELDKEHHILHYMERIDKLSGVGRFGIILIGVSDGTDLTQPLSGVGDDGKKVEGGTAERKLLYLRVYDESVTEVVEREANPASPRYGLPKIYSVSYKENTGNKQEQIKRRIHWTRVIHVADNREMSEIYGTPRIKPVYNRLYDIRKILSGSGEMFWKGAFPGYAFEVSPDDVTLDTDSLRTEMANYMDGLQRYFAVQGVTAKSLEPQVADPSGHVDAQLKAIAISLGIPTRILFGSEQAKLASTQDSETWNKRLKGRQEKYITPMIIRPVVDRFIALGILPEVEEYFVEWPDLNTPTEEDQATVLKLKVEALSKYVAGGVEALIPPEQFFMMFLKLTSDETKELLDAGEEQYALEQEEQDRLMEEEARIRAEMEGSQSQDQSQGQNDMTGGANA